MTDRPPIDAASVPAEEDGGEGATQRLSRDLVTHVFVLLRTAYVHKHDNDALIAPLRNIQDTVEGLLRLVDQDGGGNKDWQDFGSLAF